MRIGQSLVLIGIMIVVAGLVFLAIERFTGKSGLPGDIIIRRGGLTVLFPVVTMILLSLVLTLILNLFFSRR